MASEDPYRRHGAPVEQERQPGRYTLTGGRHETIFAVAHRTMGEWRTWRAIADASQLHDALDLARHEHGPTVDMVDPDVDGEQVNFSEELGLPLTLHGASPDLMGWAYLEVEDVDPSTFRLALRVDGDAQAGEAVEFSDTDFLDVDGATPVTRRFFLRSYRERFWMDLELGSDEWAVLWSHRTMPVLLAPEPTRDELLIPPRERGT